MISDFRREVYGICARLGYHAACSGNSLPTFRGQLSGPIFKEPIGSIFKKMGPINYLEETGMEIPQYGA